MPPQSIQLRDRSFDDDQEIVDLLNRRASEGPPIGVDTYREEIVGSSVRLVATAGNEVVGHAQVDPAWWTGEQDAFAVDLLVDRCWRGHGVGNTLYRAVLERVALPCRILTWVERGDSPSKRFAERHGFVDTGEVIEESRLDVAEAKMADATGLQQRLARDGIQIQSLSKFERTTSFLDALYRVWSDAGDTATREDLRRQVLEGPGLSLDTIWVALDGEQPVGMAYLKRLSINAAESDYTTVVKSHQGRGIARALKHKTIHWARNNGVVALFTSSVLTNTRMLAINHRLGYRPIAIKSEMSASLPGD